MGLVFIEHSNNFFSLQFVKKTDRFHDRRRCFLMVFKTILSVKSV